MKTEKLRTFRFTCEESEIPRVELLLREQGFDFKPEPFSIYARKLCHEPTSLGKSLAAIFGLIYIQDRSSMLPPLMLNPARGDSILDMCASPGSKTGFLAQLVGLEGFILGNEPNKLRLATLRANLQNLNFLQVATCCHKGEKINLPPGSCKNILLDPPCSGWGTADKNPQVLKLWKGDKINTLTRLQRSLLKKAASLLSVGGKLIYSTCTTNPLENEDQVRFAIDELGLKLVDLPEIAGFEWQDTSVRGALLVDGEKSQAQGFYIACLTKTEDSLSEIVEVNGVDRDNQDNKDTKDSKDNLSNQDNLSNKDNLNNQDSQDGQNGQNYKDSMNNQDNRDNLDVLDNQNNKNYRNYKDYKVNQNSLNNRDNNDSQNSKDSKDDQEKENEFFSVGFENEFEQSSLECNCLDFNLLPKGQIASFGNHIRFLPAASFTSLPAKFVWQGISLGKIINGQVQISTRLRRLMPQSPPKDSIQLDDIQSILALLSGRELGTDVKDNITGLYWRSLPLCLVRIKNGRVIWYGK